MKQLTLVLALLFFSQAATAGTAFFVRDYVSGMNRICIYDYLGSQVAITISASSICPLTIQV